MKVKILSLDKYTEENRTLKVGKKYNVEHRSLVRKHSGGSSYMYLINDTNNRPITMYAHQVEELN